MKEGNLFTRRGFVENVPWKSVRLRSNSNAGLLFLKRNFCTKPSRSPTADIVKVGKELRKHRQATAELKRLFSLAKNEKWYLLAGIGCLFVSTAVTLGVPHAIGKILDMIVGDNFPREKLNMFCFILFGIFVAGSVANFGRIHYMNCASKATVERRCRNCFIHVSVRSSAHREGPSLEALPNDVEPGRWLV